MNKLRQHRGLGGGWGAQEIEQYAVRTGPTYNDALMASLGAGHLAFSGSLAALTLHDPRP